MIFDYYVGKWIVSESESDTNWFSSLGNVKM